jgi:hypothetical protein
LNAVQDVFQDLLSRFVAMFLDERQHVLDFEGVTVAPMLSRTPSVRKTRMSPRSRGMLRVG